MGFDIRCPQTYARFGSASGPGITESYDGFGRLASTATNMDGTERVTPFGYDAAGNRTRLGPPTGANQTFAYDAAGRMTEIRASGNLMVGFVYDSVGRRDRVGLLGPANTSISYQYDPLSRLQSVTQDLAGTANDQIAAFERNAAAQVIEKTSSNDLYASNTAYTVDRSYSVKGSTNTPPPARQHSLTMRTGTSRPTARPPMCTMPRTGSFRLRGQRTPLLPTIRSATCGR
ncbi:MAG TPA: RHS repeat domain-containing protein [Allosphingosinicella sp.]|jgi:YD repeat-containing protein